MAIWDQELKERVDAARPLTDIFNPTEAPRDLAITRTLELAVEAWIMDDMPEAIRLTLLADRYQTAPKSTFERDEHVL